ncbi:MAG: hypothetical protein ACLRQF_08605 [Thomasclavelia ramosa]
MDGFNSNGILLQLVKQHSSTGNDSTYSTGVVEINLPEGESQISFVPQSGVSFNLKALSFGSYIQISSDELEEGKLAGKEITVNLKDGKFETDLNQANWVVEGLPAGITYSLKRINDTKAVIILKGNEVVDYDSNLTVTVKVDAGEIGDTGYSLSDSVMIAAVDDDETLLDIDLAFGTTEFDLMIEGGKFNQDLKVNDLV